jgi:hypothetical protein
MDPAQFFAASRVLIVAGKGGVGKSTVSAALARSAARAGLSTLIVEIEGKSGIGSLFGRPPFGYDEVVLHPGGGPEGAADVRARQLTPDDALVEYLEDHGLHRVTRRLLSGGPLDVVSTAVPGIRDILVLGKVKQLERAGAADLIVLDAPAAGHAITFLRSAHGLLDVARAGPINTQAAEVVEMLTDASRCQVLLVTLPEETPVNELVDTAYSLEDEIGVSLGPVVVNGAFPPCPGLDADPATLTAGTDHALPEAHLSAFSAAATYRRHRSQLQSEQIERLRAALPLPQLVLPYLFCTDLGPAQLDELADAAAAGIAALRALPGP